VNALFYVFFKETFVYFVKIGRSLLFYALLKEKFLKISQENRQKLLFYALLQRKFCRFEWKYL